MPPHPALLRADTDLPWLIAAAAPKEARAVALGITQNDHRDSIERTGTVPWAPIPLTPHHHLLVTGVGKACAAAAVAHTYRPDRYAGLCILGVAGALQSENHALDIGSIVIADRCIDADTGIITPGGFSDVAQMGFPPLPSINTSAIDTDLCAIDRTASPPHTVAPVATVSTCSGTDAHANEIAKRTGAACEAMEGAAAAFTAKRIAPGRPVLELRVISNTTGDRDRQRWDLAYALDALKDLANVL